MIKTIYAVTAMVIVAFVSLVFLSLCMELEADAHVIVAKGDRVDARPLGRDCSQSAWPYFEAACLRDARNPFGQAREARLVSSDRMPAAEQARAH